MPEKVVERCLAAREVSRAVSWFLVATPGYLKKRGWRRTPGDLAKHHCLFFGPELRDVGSRLETASDGRATHGFAANDGCRNAAAVGAPRKLIGTAHLIAAASQECSADGTLVSTRPV